MLRGLLQVAFDPEAGLCYHADISVCRNNTTSCYVDKYETKGEASDSDASAIMHQGFVDAALSAEHAMSVPKGAVRIQTPSLVGAHDEIPE
jgi:hypothetical protein